MKKGLILILNLLFWSLFVWLQVGRYENIQTYEKVEIKQAREMSGRVSEEIKEDVSEPYERAEQRTEEPPKIALTFDDGPHPRYTKELLEGLRERKVRVSFFLMGKNIPGREELVSQMKADGHLIGNHTYSHVDLKRLTSEEACEEILKTDQLIFDIIGEHTEYIRPPFGNWNTNLDCGIVMFPVFWNIDPRDWNTSNVDEIVRKVVKNVQEGDIILLHDCYDSTVKATFRIIDLLQAEGYEFVTVDEIVLD